MWWLCWRYGGGRECGEPASQAHVAGLPDRGVWDSWVWHMFASLFKRVSMADVVGRRAGEVHAGVGVGAAAPVHASPLARALRILP